MATSLTHPGSTQLPSHSRVVVVGGGVTGCSMLYHLAKLGWTDVMLLEKSQLTAGSTWHAAGMVPVFSKNVLVAQIIANSQAIYKSFSEDPEDPIEMHRCGNIRLSRSDDEMAENRRFVGIAKVVGIEAEVVDPKRIRELFPLLNTTDIRGGLWLPGDCYVDPSQTTQAFARAARKMGARIFQNTQVRSIRQKPDGAWQIETQNGSVQAEFVVNCGGMWAKEISALAGGVLPAVAIEHEYMVTESIREVEALDFELPMLHDMNVPMYTRPDKKGLFVSCYEDHPRFFGIEGVRADFGQELLPPDLERTESKLEVIMNMVPCLKSAGIRTVVNGPTPRSPDLMPLVGPAHGFRNFFVVCGIYGGFGFSSMARHVAEWMIYGEPGINLEAFDVRRFGSYADKMYAVRRLSTGHAFEAPVYYPHTEHTSGRPVWTSGIYHRLRTKGAVFGSRDGWEVPNWFAPEAATTTDEPAYGRANWFEQVGNEYRNVQSKVGVLDYSCLAKFEINGPDAESYLERFTVNALPKVDGLRVAPVINNAGHVIAHWIIGRISADKFYVTASSNCAERDFDTLRWGATKEVDITNVSNQTAVLALVGRHTPKLLRAVGVYGDRRCFASAFCIEDLRLDWIPVRVLRLNWGPVPVWELHTPMECQFALYEALFSAGEALGISDIGMRAAKSLRLEAGIPCFGVDIPTMCDPWQAGLGKYVDRAKWDSIAGVVAARDSKNAGRKVVHLEVSTGDGDDAVDPWGDEPVMAGNLRVGVISSAFFGYGKGKAVAFAVLDVDPSRITGDISVEILGVRHPARVIGPELA